MSELVSRSFARHVRGSMTQVISAQIPRYVRVNTKFWTSEDASKYFISKGFSEGDPFQTRCVLSYHVHLIGRTPTTRISTSFTKDEHIPDLFLFAPQTSFQNEPAHISGKIILQDKASCFPAFVLSPPAHDKCVAIDATAAPGNKTSHLSALMNGKGKVRRQHRFFTDLY